MNQSNEIISISKQLINGSISHLLYAVKQIPQEGARDSKNNKEEGLLQ